MQHISLGRALFYITLSIILIWGTLFLFVWYQKKVPFLRKNDPEYMIKIIVEDLSQEDRVPVTCIAEILELSQDRPTNIYSVDTNVFQKKLNNHPIIENASVSIIEPNILQVEYKLKEPIAYIADYENVVVDKNGAVFPLRPFFSEKVLPKLYIGSPLTDYSDRIETKELLFAFTLIDFMKQFDVHIIQIDTRDLFQDSPRRGEVIMIVEDINENMAFFFRLDARNYKEHLEKFFLFSSKIKQECVKKGAYKGIVDLRFEKTLLFKPIVEGFSE